MSGFPGAVRWAARDEPDPILMLVNVRRERRDLVALCGDRDLPEHAPGVGLVRSGPLRAQSPGQDLLQHGGIDADQ